MILEGHILKRQSLKDVEFTVDVHNKDSIYCNNGYYF